MLTSSSDELNVNLEILAYKAHCLLCRPSQR